jgi:hypothetical protein
MYNHHNQECKDDCKDSHHFLKCNLQLVGKFYYTTNTLLDKEAYQITISPVSLINYCRENMRQTAKKKIFASAWADKEAASVPDGENATVMLANDELTTAPIKETTAPVETITTVTTLSIALEDF